MILSNFTFVISKFFPYPPPIMVMIDAISWFAKNLALDSLNAFGILPLIGNIACTEESLLFLAEPNAESPSTIISSKFLFPDGATYFLGFPVRAEVS